MSIHRVVECPNDCSHGRQFKTVNEVITESHIAFKYVTDCGTV